MKYHISDQPFFNIDLNWWRAQQSLNFELLPPSNQQNTIINAPNKRDNSSRFSSTFSYLYLLDTKYPASWDKSTTEIKPSFQILFNNLTNDMRFYYGSYSIGCFLDDSSFDDGSNIKQVDIYYSDIISQQNKTTNSSYVHLQDLNTILDKSWVSEYITPNSTLVKECKVDPALYITIDFHHNETISKHHFNTVFPWVRYYESISTLLYYQLNNTFTTKQEVIHRFQGNMLDPNPNVLISQQKSILVNATTISDEFISYFVINNTNQTILKEKHIYSLQLNLSNLQTNISKSTIFLPSGDYYFGAPKDAIIDHEIECQLFHQTNGSSEIDNSTNVVFYGNWNKTTEIIMYAPDDTSFEPNNIYSIDCNKQLFLIPRNKNDTFYYESRQQELIPLIFHHFPSKFSQGSYSNQIYIVFDHNDSDYPVDDDHDNNDDNNNHHHKHKYQKLIEILVFIACAVALIILILVVVRYLRQPSNRNRVRYNVDNSYINQHLLN